MKASSLRKHKPKKRSARSIATTRVSVIVFNSENQILLVKHKKGQRQYWVLPGGRLEYGETFDECGVREVKEETGLDVEIERMIYVSEAIAPDRSRHIVNVYLLARLLGGTMRLGNEPVLAGVEFRDIEELRAMALYPPVSLQILEDQSVNFAGGVRYLGNLWV